MSPCMSLVCDSNTGVRTLDLYIQAEEAGSPFFRSEVKHCHAATGVKKPRTLRPGARSKRFRRDYFAFISATVVSSIRFEKPHSLSYQDETFTRRPDTLVSVASKFDDAGLWLKSTETSGSVL